MDPDTKPIYGAPLNCRRDDYCPCHLCKWERFYQLLTDEWWHDQPANRRP